jgi:hypothetical protein
VDRLPFLKMLFTNLLATACVLVAASAERVYLPEASGQYHVGKTQHVFNHTTHNDPVAPHGSNHTGTFFVVSIFYPSEYVPKRNETLQYLDPILAKLLEQELSIPAGTLQTLWTPYMVSSLN